MMARFIPRFNQGTFEQALGRVPVKWLVVSSGTPDVRLPPTAAQ
jgi:hypothetical protein